MARRAGNASAAALESTIYQSILTSIRDPIAVLDADLRVLMVNDVFYKTFKVTKQETEGHCLYDLGNGQWNLPKLRNLLNEVLPRHSFFDDFEVTHDFEIIGRRTMLLTAREMTGPKKPSMIVLSIQDITERLQYQSHVLTSEIRYRRLFEAAQDGILMLDPVSRQITDANSSALQVLGFPSREILGKELWEIGVFADEQTSHRFFRQLQQAGSVKLYDMTLPCKSGSTRIVELASNLYEEAGKKVIQCHIRDITERKAREEQLAAQAQALWESTRQRDAIYELVARLHRAETLTEIYDAALEFILSVLRCDRASILLSDEAGTMRFVAWRGLSETYRQSVEGHSPWDREERNPQPVQVSDVLAEMENALRAVVTAEGIRALAFIPLMAGGRLIGKFMTYYDAPHVFSDDDLDLSLNIARQLALSMERKRSEQALRESERRLDFALSAGRMGAWEWNIGSGKVTWSPGLEEIHGRLPGTFEGTFEAFKQEIHADDLDTVLAHIRQAIDTSGDYHVVYRMTRPDGRMRWMEAFGRFLLDGDGKPHKLAGVCMDITERKQAEETMRDAMKDITERTRLKEESSTQSVAAD